MAVKLRSCLSHENLFQISDVGMRRGVHPDVVLRRINVKSTKERVRRIWTVKGTWCVELESATGEEKIDVATEMSVS